MNGVPGLVSREGHFFLPIPTELTGNPTAVAYGAAAVLNLLDVGTVEEAFLLFQNREEARTALDLISDDRVSVCFIEPGVGVIGSLSGKP